MQMVIGAFDDRGLAQRAVDRLVQSGFDRQDIHMQQGSTSDSTASRQQDNQEERGWFSGFIHSLFTEDQANTGHAHTYDEALRRGSSVVVLDASDAQQAERAASLLHELGAIDVDERARQWRAQGWTGHSPTAGKDKLPERGRPDHVQEEMKVGERSLDRGGVRVVQRVSQLPLREMVRMRDGHAVVQAREREEAVEDTLRRKDVDVQRPHGGERSAAHRERAVAADRSRPPPGGRAPEATEGSGTARTRKDKPTP